MQHNLSVWFFGPIVAAAGIIGNSADSAHCDGVLA
jgi:hypothetical protein